MNALKPAIATIASAGIRRMELEQPLPSSLGTAGAHGHLAEMRGMRTWERGGGQTAAWAGKNSQTEGSALHGASARREHSSRLSVYSSSRSAASEMVDGEFGK